MLEPISDPTYWSERLSREKEHLHHAVFKCPLDRWQRIEEKHRNILEKLIEPHDSVLDAGCGWGRLLDLMPKHWVGSYVGIDLCPEFAALAKASHSSREFLVGDLRNLDKVWLPHDVFGKFTWAVLVSIRPMVKRNLEGGEWAKMEKAIRYVAENLLYLEYDELDEGSVE